MSTRASRAIYMHLNTYIEPHGLMVCMHPSEKQFIFFKDAVIVENVTVVGGCLGSEALRMEQPAAIYR